MKYTFFSLISLLLLSSCSISEAPPRETPSDSSGTTMIVDSGTTIPEPTSVGYREISESEIIALIENELEKINMGGRGSVDLGDITALESITDDNKNYTIYEGSISGPCTGSSTTPCISPRFFLVTADGKSLYFESSSSEYVCTDIDRSLEGEVLEFTKDIFCP